jgi:Pyruvate/2-oxoacid:ferredoxin oxidoreductase gamma subunit
MIGAFARVFDMPSMDAVEVAIREEVPAEVEGNIKAAEDAYNEVQLIGLIERVGVVEA